MDIKSSVFDSIEPKQKPMNYKFFDVEATGLSQSDEVCQIAIIQADVNLKITGILEEYCMPGVEFTQEASRKNGLNRNLVHALSNGQTFEQIVENNPIFREDTGAWVYYASNGFDPWICNNTLRGNGYKPISFGRTVPQIIDKYSTPGLYSVNLYRCVENSYMKGKPQNLLGATIAATGLDLDKIVKLYLKVLSALKYTPKNDNKLHNALFDSFMMFLIVSYKKDVLPRVL